MALQPLALVLLSLLFLSPLLYDKTCWVPTGQKWLGDWVARSAYMGAFAAAALLIGALLAVTG